MFSLIGVTMENFPEARLDILLELKKVKEERILKPGNKYQMYVIEKCNQQTFEKFSVLYFGCAI